VERVEQACKQVGCRAVRQGIRRPCELPYPVLELSCVNQSSRLPDRVVARLCRNCIGFPRPRLIRSTSAGMQIAGAVSSETAQQYEDCQVCNLERCISYNSLLFIVIHFVTVIREQSRSL
jgi:hypothetical protein